MVICAHFKNNLYFEDLKIIFLGYVIGKYGFSFLFTLMTHMDKLLCMELFTGNSNTVSREDIQRILKMKLLFHGTTMASSL